MTGLPCPKQRVRGAGRSVRGGRMDTGGAAGGGGSPEGWAGEEPPGGGGGLTEGWGFPCEEASEPCTDDVTPDQR